MAIEEEFFIEIPDAEADEIRTVQDGELSLSYMFSGQARHLLGSRWPERHPHRLMP